MKTERLTVSLPAESLAFVRRYKEIHRIKTTSQVIQQALHLLEQRSLFDMFTEMGRDANATDEASVQLSQAAAEDFLDEPW